MNSLVVNIMGIYVPAVAVLAVVALILTFFLRLVLDRFDFFALFWHRGIVEVSIFVLLLGGALLLTMSPGLPLGAFIQHSHHF